LIRVFITSENSLCNKGISLSGKSSYFGCFERIDIDDDNILNWTLISPNFVLDKSKEEIISNNSSWKLRLYDLNDKSSVVNMKIVPNVLEFPNNSISFYLEKDLIEPYVGQTSKYLSIKCPHCDSIRLETVNHTETIISNKINDCFSFIPQNNSDYLVVALCQESKKEFCIFNESFSNEGLALLQYLSNDGVNDLNSSSLLDRLSVGVSKQLVFNKTNTSLYKSWPGQIERIATNIPPGNVLFTFKEINKTYLQISAKLGELDIPLSANQYYNNPELFFNSIGVSKPSNGYTGEDVVFTSAGMVEAKISLVNTSSMNGSYVIDVPNSYINGSSIEYIEYHYLSTVAVVFIILACVSIVGVGCFLFYKYYYLKKKEIERNGELHFELTV